MLTFAVVEGSKETHAKSDGTLTVAGSNKPVMVENPGFTTASALTDAECSAVNPKEKDKCESKLVARHGKPLAVAPTTLGGSLMGATGVPVSTEEAIHVAGFSEYGLMDLFDSPADDLDGMKEIRSGTPDGSAITLRLSGYDFKEIFMKFAPDGSVYIPPEINNPNVTTPIDYDIVWNVLLFHTESKRYPTLLVAQTEYFGVKWGNLSDTNRSNVPKPQKYNVTRVLTPAESENYENLIYASLTQIAADQNATNGTNATSSGRRHLLGMMDEFGSEVTGAPGFYDMLQEAVHFSHQDHDVWVDDHGRIHLVDTHGRRRLLWSSLSTAYKDATTTVKNTYQTVSNKARNGVSTAVEVAVTAGTKILANLNPLNAILDFVIEQSNDVDAALAEIDDIPAAVKKLINTGLSPFLTNLSNPCQGLLNQMTDGFQDILNKLPIRFKPNCPRDSLDLSILNHLNSGKLDTIFEKFGKGIKAITGADFGLTFRELYMNCGPMLETMKEFFADFDIIEQVNDIVDNLLGEQEIKTLEALLVDVRGVAQGIKAQAEALKGRRRLMSDEENELHSTDDHVHGVLFDDAQRFFGRRALLAEDGSRLPPHMLARTRDGTIIPKHALNPTISKLHKKGSASVEGMVSDKFSEFFKRRRLAENPFDLLDLKNLRLLITKNFEQNVFMDGSKEIPYSIELYDYLGGTPIQQDLSVPILIFTIGVKIEMDIQLPIDVTFQFQGAALGTISIKDIGFNIDLVRASQDPTNIRNYLTVSTGNWSGTGYDLRGSVSMSASAGVKIRVKIAPSFCIGAVLCARVAVEAHFEAMAGGDLALTTANGHNAQIEAVAGNCITSDCQYNLQARHTSYLDYTTAQKKRYTDAAAAGGAKLIFVAGYWFYATMPWIKIYPEIVLQLGINCGVTFEGMFEYKAKESLEYDLHDCNRQGNNTAEVSAGFNKTECEQNEYPHPWGKYAIRQSDVYVKNLFDWAVNTSWGALFQVATFNPFSYYPDIPIYTWPSSTPSPPPPPLPPPPNPSPSPPPTIQSRFPDRPQCNARNGGGTPAHAAEGYGRVPMKRIRCFKRPLDIYTLTESYAVCWSPDCCLGFVMKRNWNSWLCMTKEHQDLLSKNVVDLQDNANGGLDAPGVNLR